MRTVRNTFAKTILVGATSCAVLAVVLPAGVASAAVTTSRSNTAPSSDTGTGYEWVSYFRSLAGLGSVSRNSTLEAGVAAHVRYLANHALPCETNPHDELTAPSGACQANPFATAVGKSAANNSNITRVSVNTTNRQAVSNWFTAGFHALALLDPRLTTTGYAAYYTATPLGAKPLAWPFTAGVDVYRGRTGSYNGSTVSFPGNQAVTPLTSYRVGTEAPEPFQTTVSSSPCHSWGAKTVVSAPMILQWPINSSPSMGGTIVDNTAGQSMPTCTLTASSYPSGSLPRIFLSGANGITKSAFYYASSPFVAGHTYSLHIAGHVVTTFKTAELPGAAPTTGGSASRTVIARFAAPLAGTGVISRYVGQLHTRSNCSGTPARSVNLAYTARSTTFTALSSGVVYYVRVVAVNSGGAARNGKCVAVRAG